jgi:chaperonin cofactor prefoldin
MDLWLTAEYQSLISYGRQIFQLCVGGVLFGSHLAQRSELHNKLTTNQERLELICKTLNDKSLDPSDRFTAIDDIVATVDEFHGTRHSGR